MLGNLVVPAVAAGRAEPGDPGPAGDVVALVAEHAVASLPVVDGNLVAVVCTTGAAADRLAELGRAQRVPCALGVRFDGGPPTPGSMVMVDCSRDEAVVEVVDGGTGAS